ncbi:hypothetical protein C0991_008278 [Blastosporella zonata]|nr:hypothetical protein C0991_008278 [Blastosporella zonata]
MNVLIYAGPEALQKSVAHSLATLRSILLPQYSVQTITNQALNSQPWKTSCALFVVPQCHGALQPPSSASIRDYVESGGSLLCLGAGAICSERELSGAVGISKNLLVGFLDKLTGTYVYLTHGQDKNLPDERHALHLPEGNHVEGIRGLGSSEFAGFDNEKDRNVLARFSGGSIAGLERNIGLGKVAIWASNIEVPLTKESSSGLLNASTARETAGGEKQRLQLLKSTLLSLSLRLPSVEESPVSRPLPQFLTSIPSKLDVVSKIADLLAAPSSGSQLNVFKDENDTFHFHNVLESKDVMKSARESTDVPQDPSEWQPKHIILCSTSLPDQDQSPLFDLRAYYESLSLARKAQGCHDAPEVWGCGEALLYGETVTSTQTMLDKNPRLLSRLPSPLVSLASYQLAGRGRGSNIWLSPSGCLQFSVLQRVSLSKFPASKLVFVQYLFALAVVEACRDEAVLGKWGKQVRLKWPNDVYAVVEGERKKIGGILVNTSFSGGNVDIIIGCGLNVLNAAPIFSLAQLLSPDGQKSLTLEKTVSNILARFEKMWETFVQERGSFDSFMNLYLERWLHSDQLVTLTTVIPPQLALSSDGANSSMNDSHGRPSQLLDLPIEIIIHILSYLDLDDAIYANRVNVLIRNCFQTSQILQYRFAAQAAGLENNPNHHLAIRDRLQMLRRRELGWSGFEADFQGTLPVLREPMGIYDLTGGIYLMGDVSRKTLRYCRLPSTPEDPISWSTIDLPETLTVVDIGLCLYEHDLIAETSIHQYFLDRRRGASSAIFDKKTSSPCMRACVVFGEYLALVANTRISESAGRFCVFNWKTASVVLDHPLPHNVYCSIIFLSPTYICLPNAAMGNLDIFHITPTSPPSSAPVFYASLPSISEGYSIRAIYGRAEVNPTPGGTLHSTLPFHPTSEDSIAIFNIHIRKNDGLAPGGDFSMFVHRSSLLALCEARMADGQILDWEDWGPLMTRWINIEAVPWCITTTTGQRCVLGITPGAREEGTPAFVTLLDFNPMEIKRTLAAYGVEAMHEIIVEGRPTIHVTVTEMEYDFFEGVVESALPYVSISRYSIGDTLLDFDGMLMDEERLLGVATDDHGRVERIEIFHMAADLS